LGNLRIGWFPAHRHVAADCAVFPDRRNVRFNPVTVAVFATVLDNTNPRPFGMEIGPQVSKHFGRSVRVAKDIVLLTD